MIIYSLMSSRTSRVCLPLKERSQLCTVPLLMLRSRSQLIKTVKRRGLTNPYGLCRRIWSIFVSYSKIKSFLPRPKKIVDCWRLTKWSANTSVLAHLTSAAVITRRWSNIMTASKASLAMSTFSTASLWKTLTAGMRKRERCQWG